MKASLTLHDPRYERPIRSRYLDPIDLVWLSTAKTLGITVRRHPVVFGMTEGDGILHLGERSTLDPDDCVLQMVFHEICHWITNGIESVHQRDWGFALDDELDPREHACQRVQAFLAQEFGLRDILGATGDFRQYWDQLPLDPTEPLDDSPWERKVCELAQAAILRAKQPPFVGPISRALCATAAIRSEILPFLEDYETEIKNDPLPSLWAHQ